jgi:WD40 repeat protein
MTAFWDHARGGVASWDVTTHKRLVDDPSPSIGSYFGRSTALSSDGKILAAGYSGFWGDGVMCWDTKSRTIISYNQIPVSESHIECLAVSPDGNIVATGYSVEGAYGGLVLHERGVSTRLVDRPLLVREGHIDSLIFRQDDKSIAVGYRSPNGGGVVVRETSTRNQLTEDFLPVRGGRVHLVRLGPDARTAATAYEAQDGSGDGAILWDVAARKRLLEVKGSVSSMAFSPDGRSFAAGYYYGSDSGIGLFGGKVALWDIASRDRRSCDLLTVKEGHVTSVTFSADHKIAASYAEHGFAKGGGVILWDVSSSSRLKDYSSLSVEEGHVTSVAISPDCRIVAAGYSIETSTVIDDDTPLASESGIIVWDAVTHKRLIERALRVREGEIRRLTFSPDSRTIAVGYSRSERGSIVGGVVLWDIATRKRLTDDPLNVGGGGVTDLTFSPDGRTLAVGFLGRVDHNGILFWDVDLQSWQRIAGRIAGRNFTKKEWYQYLPHMPYRRTFRELPWPPDLPETERKQAEQMELTSASESFAQ